MPNTNDYVTLAIAAIHDRRLKSLGKFQCASLGTFKRAPTLVPTYFRRDHLALSMPYLETADGKRTSFVSAENLLQAAPIYGVDIEEGRARLIEMAQGFSDGMGGLLRKLGAPDLAVKQMDAAIEWSSGIAKGASAVDLAAIAKATKKARVTWGWSP